MSRMIRVGSMSQTVHWLRGLTKASYKYWESAELVFCAGSEHSEFLFIQAEGSIAVCGGVVGHWELQKTPSQER